jgi:hypothetical protein
MLTSYQDFGLLTGFRGAPPVDIPFLEDLLMRISKIVEAHPEIEELDLNPVIAHGKGATIVDARIILQVGNE